MNDVRQAISNRMNLIKAKIDGTPTFSGWALDKKFSWNGLLISIENAKGSVRKWETSTDNGSTKMAYDYGYIRRTQGNDGDHIDCYINTQNKQCDTAYIVHQNDPITGKYDEDKVMLGFNSSAEAKAAYLKHYNSPKFFGSIAEMPLEAFKNKVIGKRVNKIR
jgi:hypothetical protein